MGKVRDARASLERSAQFDDSNAAVWLALGRAAMQANDLKRAEMSFKRAVALAPDSSEARLIARRPSTEFSSDLVSLFW